MVLLPPGAENIYWSLAINVDNKGLNSYQRTQLSWKKLRTQLLRLEDTASTSTDLFVNNAI